MGGIRKYFAAIVLIASVLGLVAVADARHGRDDGGGKHGAKSRTVQYALPGERVFPEGVGYDDRTGKWFASSTTDGTIFKGNLRRTEQRQGLPARRRRRPHDGDRHRGRARQGVCRRRRDRPDLGLRRPHRQAVRRFETGTGGFLNDVAVTRAGDVYVTDSMRPKLFRIGADQVRAGTGDSVPLDAFIELGPEAGYGPGFNWNGIVATRDGRTLIAVHSTKGALYKVDVATKAVSQIDTGTTALTNGDGLALDGKRIYVVRNAVARVAVLDLRKGLTAARSRGDFTDATFKYPTSGALVPKKRLLVVNSQFDARNAGGDGALPFTLSSVSLHR